MIQSLETVSVETGGFLDPKIVIQQVLDFVFQCSPDTFSNQEEIRGYAIALHQGELDEQGYYGAWKALKRHRRKLARSGFELPQEWVERIEVTEVSDRQYLAQNLSKGTEYTVELDDFGQAVTSCSCKAFQFGSWCNHADCVEVALSNKDQKVINLCDRLPQVVDSETLEAEVREQFFSLIDQALVRVLKAEQDYLHLANILPGIELTKSQCKALHELINFVEGTTDRHVLTGFAGCGKTLLVQALVQYMRSHHPPKKVVFTAFTNKAVKVLRSMVQKWSLNIDCMTSHSLLGLKAIEIEDRIEFQPDPNSEDKSANYDLIVVDECSMTSAELWGYLNDCSQKILFVGDIAQLPPVGEEESLVFSQVQNASHLTEVVRYGGAIGAAVEEIRNSLESKRLPRFADGTNGAGSEGIWVCDAATWEQRLIKACSSSAWQNDPDFARAIAFTNARVDSINNRIRAAIVGTKAPQFVEGEILVAYKPWMVEGQGTLLATSDECLVKGTAKGRVGDWAVWFLEVENDNRDRFTVQVLDKSEHRRFELELKKAREVKNWYRFHRLLSDFGSLKYCYAITGHRSQGSTFQNVFLDVKDMAKMPRGRSHKERNQLIYTAATRAAKRLFVYQGEV